MPLSRAVLCILMTTALSAPLISSERDSPHETAMELARRAKRAGKAGHNSEAYLLYSQAAAIEPKNRSYRARMTTLKDVADAEQNSHHDARPVPAPESVAPAPAFDSITAREYAEARQPLAPPELKARPGTQNFDLNAGARTLFDEVARRFGLSTAYDSDYPAAGPQIRFRVTDVDYREALHDLEAATNSFVVPLSPRLILVAADTTQKRAGLERTMTIAIPVPQPMTPQELNELTQAVRQAFNLEKIGTNSAHSEILIRDRVSRVEPAKALLQELLWGRPEVMIDVEFLEIASSDIVNYGFNVTNTFSATYLGHILNNVVTYPSGVMNLVTFGGGKTLIGLSVAQVQAMFNQTLSTSNTLFSAQQRSVDGQTATFHVGERYPVITSQYAGQVAAGQQNQVYAPPPSFTYEDLGVVVKVTPHIHGDGETTLAVDTSYQVLTGTVINSLPVIGRREVNTSVRLRDGEWAVVAGLMNPTSSKATGGFWGLAQVPLLGNLFKQTSTDHEDTNILIAIKPNLLSLPADQIVAPELRAGSDTRPFNNF